MAEVLVEYPDVISAQDGSQYTARACGTQVTENSWHGWIEFTSLGGNSVVRSPRETTQPNRTDAVYWATGITPVYLEGALQRALHPPVHRPVGPAREPVFDSPAPGGPVPGATADAVLDPFALYAKSEQLLRRRLTAFSSWHLVNIVNVYRIPTATDPNRMEPSELVDAIVAAARERAGATLPD